MMIDKVEKNNLLIVGMGQYGLLTKEIAQAMGIFGKIAFLDDGNPNALGTCAEMAQFATDYHCAVVAIGNPELRKNYLEELAKFYKIATLIHPQSYVSPSAIIAPGCIVEPMAVVHTAAEIGCGSIISAGVVVNHNCTIGSFCHLDCNSTITARMQVSSGTKVTAGQVV